MPTTEKFWLVWCPPKGPPSVRHSSESEARIEAERLAAAHPGFEFFVLEAASISVTAKPVTTTKLETPRPF